MRTHRAVTLSILLSLAVVLAGCATDKFIQKKGGSALKWKLARDGDNHYLQAIAKKTEPTSGFVLVKRDLRPPFRWEATIGFFGKDGPADGETGTFGTELDATGTSPLQFYGISAQPVGGGLNAFAASHQSAPGTHGAKFYEGARRLDVAIVHDGTNLRFLARESGVGEYDEIASITTPWATFPVQPGVGAAFIRKPTRVGYDNFRVVSNGELVGGSADEYAAESIYGAVDKQVGAMHDLDGPEPDRAGILARLKTSQGQLDDAIGEVNVLRVYGKSKKPKVGPEAAAKLLGKAKKKLASAVKKLEKGKAAKSIVKEMLKVLRPELEAADALKNGP